MLSWSVILYGAVLSAVLTGVVVALLVRQDRPAIALVAAAGAFAGPFAWNAILHAARASQFFVDAPVPVLPVSWQDTGSGVFATAVASLLLGFGPLRDRPARISAALALTTGLIAFLVDVYLY